MVYIRLWRSCSQRVRTGMDVANVGGQRDLRSGRSVQTGIVDCGEDPETRLLAEAQLLTKVDVKRGGYVFARSMAETEREKLVKELNMNKVRGRVVA